jgi:putative membrane protein
MIRTYSAVTLLLTAAAFAQTGSSDRMKSGSDMVPMADQHFMMKAAQGGMAEVQLGKLATQNASSQAVKDFGQKMVDDHSKANDELKGLAARKNVTLPSSIDAKDQATMDRLSQVHGAAFDRAYMRDMVADHKKDIAEFQREANSGADPDVKNWASQTLPTLQGHLQLAESTRGKM